MKPTERELIALIDHHAEEILRNGNSSLSRSRSSLAGHAAKIVQLIKMLPKKSDYFSD